jgi:hypothetical protein
MSVGWAAVALAVGHGQEVSQVGAPVSAEVGRPKIYRYDRVAQLWEGIGLDGYAITVAQLNLNPTAQNAAQTDVVQSSVQGSVQFNPVQGALNALSLQGAQTANQQNLALANAAGQQNSQAAQAGTNFQVQMMNQIAPLLTSLQSAQQVQGQAQATVSALAPADAANPQNPAVIALNQATANVNNLITDISTAKGLITSPSTSVTAGTAVTPVIPTATGVAPTSQTAPTMLLPTVTAPSVNNGPTLPASKQLDAQFDTLWDRLTRVATLLSQPDNLDPNDELFLIEFDASVLAAPGKNRLLHTGYSVSCSDGKSQEATVLDVYPRIAAVNIGENKFRDSKVSLGFLASLFSIGVSAAYNREHLKMTQALSPSSYVTGYGLGASTFGWYFGAVLGEDKVAPGIRKTYVLVALNQACEDSNHRLEIQQESLEWTKSLQQGRMQNFIPGTWTFQELSDSMQLVRMEYTPISFAAPTTLVPSAAPLITALLTFDKRVDQALTISSNGVNLYRVRDNFARATPPSSGLSNSGLLEQQSPGPGTWTLMGDREIVVRLDPTQYTQGFPDLQFTTPRGPLYLHDFLEKMRPPDPVHHEPYPFPVAEVNVYGHPFQCGERRDKGATPWQTACSPGQLPPLGVVSSTTSSKIYATRYRELPWQGQTENDRINLTVGSGPATGGSVTSGSTQVIQQGLGHLWSTSSYAMLYDRDAAIWFSLKCEQGSFRLECTVPNLVDHGHRFNIYTADSLYDSGPVAGPVELTQCNDQASDPCRRPFIWSVGTPTEATDQSGWTMSVKVLGACPENDCANTAVKLLNPKLGSVSIPASLCKSMDTCPQTDIRQFDFTILKDTYAELDDVMAVEVKVGGAPSGYYRIGPVLSAVTPLVKSVTVGGDGKSTEVAGLNLIFDAVRVGSNTKEYPATCKSSMGQDWCTYLIDSAKTAGPIYFVKNATSTSPKVIGPLRLLAADGITIGAALAYTPPPAPKGGAGQAPGGTTITLSVTNGPNQSATTTATTAGGQTPTATTSPAPAPPASQPSDNTAVSAQMSAVPALTANFFNGAQGSAQAGDQASAAPNSNPTQMYIVPQ